MQQLIPSGHSIGCGNCLVEALKKIRSSNCVKMRISIKKESGEFVVCKGDVLEGNWKGAKGEEAWNKLLEELSSLKDVPVHITFYPPPENVDLLEELDTSSLAESEMGSEYVASVSVLALGKTTLGIIHRLQALGLEFEDIKLTVEGEVAELALIGVRGKVDVEVVRRVALQYLESLGVKEVEVSVT